MDRNDDSADRAPGPRPRTGSTPFKAGLVVLFLLAMVGVSLFTFRCPGPAFRIRKPVAAPGPVHGTDDREPVETPPTPTTPEPEIPNSPEELARALEDLLKNRTLDAEGHYVGLTDGQRRLALQLIAGQMRLRPNDPLLMAERRKVGFALWDGRERIETYAGLAGLPATLRLRLSEDVQMELRLIPAGTFQMGSPESERDRDPLEQLHSVTLTRPFYLGIHEVTQAQYEAVMGVNPARLKSPDHPVESVNWREAFAYCERLSKELKLAVRLPTEAEWEFACRAGTKTAYHFGARITVDRANYYGTEHDDGRKGEYRNQTMRVGAFKPNAWGLYDMHGNVWEFCLDWYGPYDPGPVRDPKGPETGRRRVQRGGSWYSLATACRSAWRDQDLPWDRGRHYGFRVLVECER